MLLHRNQIIKITSNQLIYEPILLIICTGFPWDVICLQRLCVLLVHNAIVGCGSAYTFAHVGRCALLVAGNTSVLIAVFLQLVAAFSCY